MSESIKLKSPVDGSVYVERPLASDREIAAATERAIAAQADWARRPIAERATYVLAMLEALLGMNDEIVTELAWQMGRPVRYGGEKGGVEERTRYMVRLAEKALAPYVPEDRPGFRRYIKREPLGVVFVIAPWNYPYLTTINSVVPGLMAGNAIILKHAAQTLLVGERFQKAFDAAGLPKGLFQNLVMSHGQTEALLKSGKVEHCNFTGSVAGGRAIEIAAAGTFMTLGLELGGKDPAYVLPDAKLDHAIANLVEGAFYNSGQCCCGIERIYVHERVYDDFLEGFIAETKKSYVLGNPLDQATTMGPMAQPRFADFIREQKAEALRKGAVAHLNTKAEGDRAGSPYLPAEVLTNVDHQMSVMREESFGPIVGIMKVRNDEEALALMNDSPYGLTASVWTTDTEHAIAVGDRIETGTVLMNRCDYLDPGLVWTGVKDTGKGGAMSEVGYDNLTRPKSYHLREKI